METVAAGDWLKMYYEQEIFTGKVLTKPLSVQVKCHKHPFGIHVPQNMKCHADSVHYDTVL